jgi:DNA polymerase III alpha subunit (gram-positive type)
MSYIPTILRNESKFFFCDTETTGIMHDSQILTFYAAITDSSFGILDELNLKIKYPTYIVQPQALSVNQINLIEHHNSKDAVFLDRAKSNFNDFIIANTYNISSKLCFAGHATAFDIGYLKNNLCSDFEHRFLKHTLDTGVIATLLKQMGLLPSDFEISLANLIKFYNVECGTLHEAKNDVKATMAVLKCMIAKLNSPNL